MQKLLLIILALLSFTAFSQKTVGLSIAVYSEDACTTFIGSSDFYGKTDGTECSQFQGKGIKYACNSTHIVITAYNSITCAGTAIGTTTTLVGQCSSGTKAYCGTSPISGQYIKSEFFTGTTCAANNEALALNLPIGVCSVSLDGADGVKYACVGNNVTSLTYSNSKTCSGTGKLDTVEDKKCYAQGGTASIKFTCTSNAVTIAFYWSVALMALIFLTL